MANSIISIQIIPGLEDRKKVYRYVDAAIKVIEDAGIKYEVHPLETTMEGEMGELLSVIQQMNEQLIHMGAINVISQIKVLYQPGGITGATLTEKYR